MTETETVTGYRLPEGMTAEWLRRAAEHCRTVGGVLLADDIDRWADEIDPPKPSIVTHEMAMAVFHETHADSEANADHARDVLEAAERLGLLRDPAEVARLAMAEGLLRRVVWQITEVDNGDPWLQTFDTAVTDAEIDYLRSLGKDGDQ